MVISFNDCIARPDLQGKRYPLSEHLEVVARNMGDPSGDPLAKLRFLAGLLHDMGKARASWQKRIRSSAVKRGSKVKLVNHAPLGSALFVFFGSKFLPLWEPDRKELKVLDSQLLSLTLDLYDHHGRLRDLEETPPWEGTLSKEDLIECDLSGISDFIKGFFPVGNWNESEIMPWLEKAPENWRRAYYEYIRLSKKNLRSYPAIFHGAADICMEKRVVTSKMIFADRYHAAGFETYETEFVDPGKSLEKFSLYCQSKAAETMEKGGKSSEIVKMRQDLQKGCLDNYKANIESTFLSLLLPTGLGKTLTATRIALEGLVRGRCKKIIYVAPYLSILSQATAEIAASTGLEVFQHTHLALFDSEGDITERDLLAMDSWEAPVITTTFNQFFRALFPRRAQHTLRMAGLEQAFVIIDEPQIIDLSNWNLFLHMLEAAAKSYKLQVLFSSATMPVFSIGLNDDVFPLAPKFAPPDRYKILALSELDEEGVVDLALSSLADKGSVAIILNTIQDAGKVYQLLKEHSEQNFKCFNMTGCMTSLHKAKRILEIKESLDRNEKTAVVSTQVLECGVDLSFNTILRALPVLPSLAQAAGRANRHHEGEKAEVLVFQFLRDGKTDTRQYVYRAEEARRVTNNFIREKGSWDEPETTSIIMDYFGELMRINTRISSLELLESAALGQWSKIGGLEPFLANYPQVDVFVPFGEDDLPETAKQLLNEITNGQGAERLYELYMDKEFRSGLGFIERKKVMGLIQQFCVSLDPAVARTLIAGVEEDTSIVRIADPDQYSPETGLAHHLGLVEDVGGISL